MIMVCVCVHAIISVTCDLGSLCKVPTVLTCLSEDKEGDGGTSFTLEDVFNSSLKPKSYSMEWISGGRAAIISPVNKTKSHDDERLIRYLSAARFSVVPTPDISKTHIIQSQQTAQEDAGEKVFELSL